MKVVGVWSLTNSSSLNVYDIKHGIDDEALIGLNNHSPEWTEIKHDKHGEAYIKYGSVKFFFKDCMRV